MRLSIQNETSNQQELHNKMRGGVGRRRSLTMGIDNYDERSRNSSNSKGHSATLFQVSKSPFKKKGTVGLMDSFFPSTNVADANNSSTSITSNTTATTNAILFPRTSTLKHRISINKPLPVREATKEEHVVAVSDSSTMNRSNTNKNSSIVVDSRSELLTNTKILSPIQKSKLVVPFAPKTSPQHSRRSKPFRLENVYIPSSTKECSIPPSLPFTKSKSDDEPISIQQRIEPLVQDQTTLQHSTNATSVSIAKSTRPQPQEKQLSPMSHQRRLLPNSFNEIFQDAIVPSASGINDDDNRSTSIRNRKGGISCKVPNFSPQTYLDTLLLSRGYHHCSSTAFTSPTNEISCLQPTVDTSTAVATHSSIKRNHNISEYDLASFGLFVVGVAQIGDVDRLTTLFDQGSLSPNACNGCGESLCRIVCRRGDYKSLRVLLQFGCTIETIVDEFGQNPFHFACSCSNVQAAIATIKVMLDYLLCNDTSNIHDYQNDIKKSIFRLFYESDHSGQLPLSHTRQHDWGQWIHFFASNKDRYLPENFAGVVAVNNPFTITPTTKRLPLHIVRMVASGQISPAQAWMTMTVQEKNISTSKVLPSISSRTSSKIDDILSQIENAVLIRKQQKESQQQEQQQQQKQTKSRRRRLKKRDDHGSIDNKSIPVSKKFQNTDVDSTAYPTDSESGVEFYYDDGNDDNEQSVATKNEQNRDSTTSYVVDDNDDHGTNQNDDVDSIAYPDSVSGIELYDDYDGSMEDSDNDCSKHNKEHFVDTMANRRNKCGRSNDNHSTIENQNSRFTTNDNEGTNLGDSDVDSTAYPNDSVVTGIEFYCESIANESSSSSCSSNNSRDRKNSTIAQGSSEHDDDDDDDNYNVDDVDSTAFPDSIISGVEFY